MDFEFLNYLSLKLVDISLTTFISSSALIALIVFLVNEYKERRRFHLYCRILHQEIAQHKHWLEILSIGTFDVSEFLISENASKDWDIIKYNSTFLRISRKNLDVLLQHYRNLRSLQIVIRKSQQVQIFMIAPSILEEKYTTALEALKILEKIIGIDHEKHQQPNNQ